MRDASTPDTTTEGREGFTCASCRRLHVTAIEGLFYNPQVGSPSRFCSPACRTAAWRRRAGAPEDTPRQHQGGSNRRLQPDTTEAKTKINQNQSKPAKWRLSVATSGDRNLAIDKPHRTAGVRASTFHAKATIGTIRAQLINVPARLARSARRLTLHLPADWPWCHDWEQLRAGATPPAAA